MPQSSNQVITSWLYHVINNKVHIRNRADCEDLISQHLHKHGWKRNLFNINALHHFDDSDILILSETQAFMNQKYIKFTQEFM